MTPERIRQIADEHDCGQTDCVCYKEAIELRAHADEFEKMGEEKFSLVSKLAEADFEFGGWYSTRKSLLDMGDSLRLQNEILRLRVKQLENTISGNLRQPNSDDTINVSMPPRFRYGGGAGCGGHVSKDEPKLETEEEQMPDRPFTQLPIGMTSQRLHEMADYLDTRGRYDANAPDIIDILRKWAKEIG